MTAAPPESAPLRQFTAAGIQAALPMAEAVVLMRQAFRDISAGRASLAERQQLALPGGTGLLMGAALPGTGLLAKLVSVLPGNAPLGLPVTNGCALLASEDTGQPLALFDGAALTAWRTAAATACAIDTLAAPGSERALVIGCGGQAATLVRALDSLGRFTAIEVHARRRDRAEAFVAAHREALRTPLRVAGEAGAAVAAADVVVTATTSATPVFDAGKLAAGTLLCAIGSFRADMCEFDPRLCRQADIFVDSRAGAAAEAGELIAALDAGWTAPQAWTELGEALERGVVPAGGASRRRIYKSVGHVLFDLHAARAIMRAAEP